MQPILEQHSASHRRLAPGPARERLAAPSQVGAGAGDGVGTGAPSGSGSTSSAIGR